MPISRKPRPGSAKITKVTSSERRRHADDSKTFSPERLKNFFNRIAERVKVKNSPKNRNKHRVTIDLEMDRASPNLVKIQNNEIQKRSRKRRPKSFESLKSQKSQPTRKILADRASVSEKSNYSVNRLKSKKIRFKTKIGKIISINRKPRRARSLYSVSRSQSARSSPMRRSTVRKRIMHPLRTMRKNRTSRIESSCQYLESLSSPGRHAKCGKWCKTSRKSTHDAIHRIDDSFTGHYKCKKWLEENVLVNDFNQNSQPTTSVRCDFCRFPVQSTNNRFRRRISKIFGKFRMNGIFNDGPELTKLSRGDGLKSASNFVGTYGSSTGIVDDDSAGPCDDFVDDSLSDIPEVKPSLKRFFSDEEPQFRPQLRKSKEKSKPRISKTTDFAKI